MRAVTVLLAVIRVQLRDGQGGHPAALDQDPQRPYRDVEREAGEHVDALRVALEALVDVADLDEGHAGVRGQGSGCGPYAEARPWGVNAPHQHQRSKRRQRIRRPNVLSDSPSNQ